VPYHPEAFTFVIASGWSSNFWFDRVVVTVRSGSVATESRRERVVSCCASAGAMDSVVASSVEKVKRIVVAVRGPRI
jgi:hypothetical protein